MREGDVFSLFITGGGGGGGGVTQSLFQFAHHWEGVPQSLVLGPFPASGPTSFLGEGTP